MRTTRYSIDPMSFVVVGTGVQTLADVTPRWDRASQTWRVDCHCGWRWHDSTERLARARTVQHGRDGCWPANVVRLGVQTPRP